MGRAPNPLPDIPLQRGTTAGPVIMAAHIPAGNYLHMLRVTNYEPIKWTQKMALLSANTYDMSRGIKLLRYLTSKILHSLLP